VIGLPDLAAIRRVRASFAPHVRHTPLEPSPELSLRSGADVHLKLECLQVTGGFKARGAFAELCALDPAARRRGCVVAGGGTSGHGRAVAHAARALGIPATVFLAHDVDPAAVDLIRRLGAELRFFPDVAAAHAAARELAATQGLCLVGDDAPAAVAAGGTVALEILDDFPAVDLILVGTAAGGLAAGIGVVLDALRPHAEVWVAQPTVSAVPAAPLPSGWRDGGRPRAMLLPEREVRAAMRWLLEQHQLVVEPAAAAPLAVLLGYDGVATGRRVAVVLGGRNIPAARYLALVAEARGPVGVGDKPGYRL
jgi:threonine dehydratase